MIKDLKYVFLLLSIASRLLAFSSEDIAEGRVKKIDLPAGHSMLVPHYFEVEQATSEDANSVKFGDPVGYLYCTVELLQLESRDNEKIAQNLIEIIRDHWSDAVIGEPNFDYFTLGHSKGAVYFHLPITAPIKMSLSHLVVQAEETMLHITISIPAKYEGPNAGMETRFTKMILLSLKNSAGMSLKRSER